MPKAGTSNKKGLIYAVLKHGTLFCYKSEKSRELVKILHVQDFIISLYPSINKETPKGKIYTGDTVICLVLNALPPLNGKREKMNPSAHTLDDTTINSADTLYLTCARKTDKEDWNFSLLEGQNILVDAKTEKVQFVMMDDIHFDRKAIEALICRVQSSPNERETAWINAICGRLFLGIYRTDRLKQFVENKIIKKIDRTKTPESLEQIKVTKVEIGNYVPHITDPKLLSLSPQAEVIVEAKVEYNGGLTIEIETDFIWSYSLQMEPIRMHLALSVNFKKKM